LARKKLTRDTELGTREKIKERLLELFKDVEKGFTDQRDRADQILCNWDMYNCVLGEKQFYNGNSKIYVPFVRDAIDARVTRFSNQLFPQSGRYVEVTTMEADQPQAMQALLEHYVRRCKIRTDVVPPLLRNGDMEGQYTIYVTWAETERQVTYKKWTQPETDGMENEAAEPVEDVKDETIVDARPDVELISDTDFSVIPATAYSIPQALAVGGAATIIRRWTKARIKKAIKDGDIIEEEGEVLLKRMDEARTEAKTDIAKEQADNAGIKAGGKYALIYETWTMIKVEDDMRMCRIFYGGEKQILGCKQNPFWHGMCPVLSIPAPKISGVFKGTAKVQAVEDLQIFANDTINEGADTAHFSAMPIVMTDPVHNPRIETMVLGLGAVWPTSPKDTQIVEFPDLWRSALERAAAIQNQIFQSLSVNPSMIPQGTGGPGKKRNQAEIANEQAVDLLTTADAVTLVEEGILTPMIQMFAWLDQQYRDADLTIRTYGPMGEEANMQVIPPIQMDHRYEYRWYGVEVTRTTQAIQQQIAMLNVAKSIPPQMYPEYDLDVAPFMVQMFENAMGPRLAALTFKKKKKISVDPIIENEMMEAGYAVPVHPVDDDLEHMSAHMFGVQAAGGEDPLGVWRDHMMKHQAQMQQKALMEQQQAQGNPGSQGGPKPGGQPGTQRGVKGPPGAIHADQMAAAGSPGMPRKT